MATVPPDAFPHVDILRSGRAKGYKGVATAVRTFEGVVVILMARDRTQLAHAMREMNPATKVDESKMVDAHIVPSSSVTEDI